MSQIKLADYEFYVERNCSACAAAVENFLKLNFAFNFKRKEFQQKFAK